MQTNTFTTHIEDTLNKIRSLYVETAEAIEALKPGEKVPATQLAQTIAERHGMAGASLYPILKMLFEGYPGIDLKKGAHGGICRK